MRIILDTNFLMAVAQFKIDIFSEIQRIADFRYQVCILDKTVDELDNIIKTQKGKDKAAAKLALQVLEAHDVKKIFTGPGRTDDLIVDESGKDTVVATQDKELKARIKAKGIRVIGIRQKRYLFISP